MQTMLFPGQLNTGCMLSHQGPRTHPILSRELGMGNWGRSVSVVVRLAVEFHPQLGWMMLVLVTVYSCVSSQALGEQDRNDLGLCLHLT